ncbi:hypothetical protein EUTSA_v10026718mg [Eutrema salsugineum]|uniref:Uncharacterized protein n=1 Tax=Eutrema salsugineum TaxID=72664 RepID=V4MRU0_EUTSA|nr:hypothetical protein EUTSA_v10026718mg [Eutrema salsugineum]
MKFSTNLCQAIKSTFCVTIFKENKEEIKLFVPFAWFHISPNISLASSLTLSPLYQLILLFSFTILCCCNMLLHDI